MKLTTAEDMEKARPAFSEPLETRVGGGYDVHAFTDGDAVMLGGVASRTIAVSAGHSDADVVLHALTDAILGALADGDIGSHFPPSDPQWRGASSDRFLAFAVERVERGAAPLRISIQRSSAKHRRSDRTGTRCASGSPAFAGMR